MNLIKGKSLNQPESVINMKVNDTYTKIRSSLDFFKE